MIGKCVIFYCLFIAPVLPAVIQNSWDAQDRMGSRDKTKLIWLAKELVKEAKLYMRQVHDIVEEYSPLMAFEVGVILGKIREKLKLMMEMYRQIRDRYSQKNKLFGPGIRVLRPMHYILVMENIHTLEVEIDKFVSVLENIPIDRWEDDPLHADPSPRRQKKKKNKSVGRQGAGSNDTAGNLTETVTENEQQIKSKLREQFLMRRLGMPDNFTTTKKRFLDHWPVEDTWSLEQYSLA